MDTSLLIDAIGGTTSTFGGLVASKEGDVHPEMLINLDAGAIIVLQIAVSAFVARFRPLGSMVGGIIVSSAAVGLAFAFASAPAWNGFWTNPAAPSDSKPSGSESALYPEKRSTRTPGSISFNLKWSPCPGQNSSGLRWTHREGE